MFIRIALIAAILSSMAFFAFSETVELLPGQKPWLIAELYTGKGIVSKKSSYYYGPRHSKSGQEVVIVNPRTGEFTRQQYLLQPGTLMSIPDQEMVVRKFHALGKSVRTLCSESFKETDCMPTLLAKNPGLGADQSVLGTLFVPKHFVEIKQAQRERETDRTDPADVPTEAQWIGAVRSFGNTAVQYARRAAATITDDYRFLILGTVLALVGVALLVRSRNVPVTVLALPKEVPLLKPRTKVVWKQRVPSRIPPATGQRFVRSVRSTTFSTPRSTVRARAFAQEFKRVFVQRRDSSISFPNMYIIGITASEDDSECLVTIRGNTSEYPERSIQPLIDMMPKETMSILRQLAGSSQFDWEVIASLETVKVRLFAKHRMEGETAWKEIPLTSM